MPHVRKAREEDLKDEKISQAEYDKIESLERNHISSISTAHSNIGYLLTLVINLSVLLPLQGNPFADNLALCLTNSCMLPSHDFGSATADINRLGCPWSLGKHKSSSSCSLGRLYPEPLRRTLQQNHKLILDSGSSSNNPTQAPNSPKEAATPPSAGNKSSSPSKKSATSPKPSSTSSPSFSSPTA
jgi:hypothetical protein